MASNSRFQDISDTYASNELVLIALCTLGFVLLLRFLNPLTSTSTQEIFSPSRIEKRFLPGLFQGTVIALGIILAFVLSGFYRYLGVLIQPDEALLAIVSILVRIIAVIVFAYCDEFILRQKALSYFRRQLPVSYAILLIALIGTGIKFLQFDLGFMQLTTLFLLGLSLGLRAINDGDFTRGAGIWAGVLLVFQPFLSLSVLGNDFQGIFLVKYEFPSEAENEVARILTGGIGGPLSSFAIQMVLVFDIARNAWKNKKILWPEKNKFRPFWKLGRT